MCELIGICSSTNLAENKLNAPNIVRTVMTHEENKNNLVSKILRKVKHLQKMNNIFNCQCSQKYQSKK